MANKFGALHFADDTFPWRVQGVPCFVEVTHFCHQPPSVNGNSSDDYYGFTEIEYRLLDTGGHPAPWLEIKKSEAECREIIAEIKERFTREEEY